ncbi:hypothetical protein GYMLUDRAFT_253443 [Collybiopsis luxurians FD-317 M1]|uniref:Ribonuclease H1 N-terminal domain-containing protein n=1 Tax=Collybiopsis luxurians FD-317 M1 TaxID=944289 RepID=A0A0D0AIG0_9AGAR|nr:hypothetical protein GYMLUDRAFT_253443 [Collybiopsis luxurians FD-317 M1]
MKSITLTGEALAAMVNFAAAMGCLSLKSETPTVAQGDDTQDHRADESESNTETWETTITSCDCLCSNCRCSCHASNVAVEGPIPATGAGSEAPAVGTSNEAPAVSAMSAAFQSSARSALSSQRWYAVTRGRAIRVFQDWSSVSLFVTGVSRACYVHYSTWEEADTTYNAAVCTQNTKVICNHN